LTLFNGVLRGYYVIFLNFPIPNVAGDRFYPKNYAICVLFTMKSYFLENKFQDGRLIDFSQKV